MDRKDWYLGPFHFIKRSTGRSSQYGFLLWTHEGTRGATLDVWLRHTLFTLRRPSL